MRMIEITTGYNTTGTQNRNPFYFSPLSIWICSYINIGAFPKREDGKNGGKAIFE